MLVLLELFELDAILALATQSLAFAFAHIAFPMKVVVSRFAMGLILGLVAWWSQTWIIAAIAHLYYNLRVAMLNNRA